jgi:hypothetical protein
LNPSAKRLSSTLFPVEQARIVQPLVARLQIDFNGASIELNA